MDKILQYKEIIIQTAVVLLPIISMMIPKLVSDSRVRKLLGSIEVGADLKSNAYQSIMLEVNKIRNALDEFEGVQSFLDNVKHEFIEAAKDLKIVDKLKEELIKSENTMRDMMDLVQELIVKAHDTVKVENIIKIQNEQIAELADTVKKLSTRLGGK